MHQGSFIIPSHFCTTAAKPKKHLESCPIRGDRLDKAHDRDLIRF